MTTFVYHITDVFFVSMSVLSAGLIVTILGYRINKSSAREGMVRYIIYFTTRAGRETMRGLFLGIIN